MAQSSHCRPSSLLGLPPDSPAAYDYDRAVYRFGTWFERKRTETRKVRRPKRDDGMMEVPRYTTTELGAFLGIGKETGDTAGTVSHAFSPAVQDPYDLLDDLDDLDDDPVA